MWGNEGKGGEGKGRRRSRTRWETDSKGNSPGHWGKQQDKKKYLKKFKEPSCKVNHCVEFVEAPVVWAHDPEREKEIFEGPPAKKFVLDVIF